MKQNRRFLPCVLVAIGFAQTLLAADTERDEVASILANAVQLESQLDSKSLRLLDVRGEAEYQEGHIPGAVRVPVGAWKLLAASENGFANSEAWAKQLGALGITNESTVIVYGGKLSDAARVWWLLKYVGVEQVQLLDGGWDHWKQHDRPAQTSTPNITSTVFTPEFQRSRLAEMPEVLDLVASKKATLLDTRSTKEFNAGRIPGSEQLEWSQLIAEDGRFKSVSELNRLFKEYGIAQTDAAVCY